MIDYQYFEGGLTDTPEIRYTPNGRGVATFTLAQSDSRKNDQDEWETTANRYLRVSIWDNQRVTWTDVLAGLDKGTKMVVRGKLVTNKWQDKDGNNRSQLEVQAFHAYIDAATGAQAPQQGGQQPSGWQVQDSRGGFGQQGQGNQQSQQGTWGEPATTGKEDNPPF